MVKFAQFKCQYSSLGLFILLLNNFFFRWRLCLLFLLRLNSCNFEITEWEYEEQKFDWHRPFRLCCCCCCCALTRPLATTFNQKHNVYPNVGQCKTWQSFFFLLFWTSPVELYLRRWSLAPVATNSSTKTYWRIGANFLHAN